MAQVGKMHNKFFIRINEAFFRHAGKLKFLFKFFSLQIVLQFLNLLFGLLIVRWLPIEEYAKYSIAFGFQSILNVMIDLGFSNAVTGMVGKDYGNRKIIGEYLTVVSHYRKRLFIVVMPIGCAFFFYITQKHSWTVSEQIIIFSSLTIFLLFQTGVSYYSPVLLLHKKVGSFYLPQLIGGGVKVLVLTVGLLAKQLNTVFCIWLNTAALGLNFFRIKKSARSHYDEQNILDQAKVKEVRNYLLPIIPGVIFWSLQGQISLFLISIFGETKKIAEVAALGRLGQIMVLVGALNSVVILPYLAKREGKKFVQAFIVISLGAVLFCCLFLMSSKMFPEIYLSILGPKYTGLHDELQLVILSGCISYLGSLFYSVQAIKKWLFWWHSFAYIAATILAQVWFILFFRLDNTFDVLLLNVLVASISAVSNLVVCLILLLKPKFRVGQTIQN